MWYWKCLNNILGTFLKNIIWILNVDLPPPFFVIPNSPSPPHWGEEAMLHVECALCSLLFLSFYYGEGSSVSSVPPQQHNQSSGYDARYYNTTSTNSYDGHHSHRQVSCQFVCLCLFVCLYVELFLRWAPITQTSGLYVCLFVWLSDCVYVKLLTISLWYHLINFHRDFVSGCLLYLAHE